jgi:DNA-binding NarL/FixJ family response regulator
MILSKSWEYAIPMGTGSNNAIIMGSNAGLRDTLRAGLKGMGFAILESTPSGALVLDKLSDEETRCDLIICELKIESMTIQAFLKELRTMPDFDETMVILLASDEENDLLESCLAFGIGAVIRKPFNNDNLAALVQAPFQKLKFLGDNYKALYLSTFSIFSESVSRYRSAIKYLEECVKLSPAAITHFELGRLYLRIKKGEEGISHLNKAGELNPGFSTPIAKLITQYTQETNQEVGISKASIKLFMTPLKQFSSAFHNSGRIKKSIVIGGNHVDRVSVKNFLSNLGIKNVTLHDKVESVTKLLQDCDVDLVVTWLKLGASDAASLTKMLRGIYSSREMKIIVVAEESQAPALGQVIELGADGFFFPPFIADRFCQRMHRCMVLHELCSISGASAFWAKAAYSMYECGDYARGKTFAEKGLKLNANDVMCELFLAVNSHRLFERDKAFKLYDHVIERSSDLADLVQQLRAENEQICCDLELQQAAKKAIETAKNAPKSSPAEAPSRTQNAQAKGAHSQNTQAQEAQPQSKPQAPKASDASVSPAASENGQLSKADSSAPKAAAAAKKRRRTTDSAPVVSAFDGGDVRLEAASLKPAEPSATPQIPVPNFAVPPSASSSTQVEEALRNDVVQKAPHPPQAPPVAQEPPKMEFVQRKRVHVQSELMGEFENVEQLQKEIFGRTEKINPEVSIPRSIYDQGVSEVDLIQPLGLERVFHGNIAKSGGSEFGNIAVVENVVVPWLPTEVIENCHFEQNTSPPTDGKIIEVATKAQEDKGKLILIAGQARLLNSRIICLPDKHENSQSFENYVSTLGKVVAERDLINVLGLEQGLDDKLK